MDSYLGCLVVNNFLVSEITFIAHQKFVDIFTSISIYLLQPLLHIIKRFLRDKTMMVKGDLHIKVLKLLKIMEVMECTFCL